jgi:hypothetical protein
MPVVTFSGLIFLHEKERYLIYLVPEFETITLTTKPGK